MVIQWTDDHQHDFGKFCYLIDDLCEVCAWEYVMLSAMEW